MQIPTLISKGGTAVPSVLGVDEWLRPGEFLSSDNGYHNLVMQDDGNLVLYSLGTPVWQAGSSGEVAGLVMQEDGNLVIYRPGGAVAWASNAHGHGRSILAMQDDRNAVTYRLDGGGATWSSGTFTSMDLWEPVEFEASPDLMLAAQQDPETSMAVLVGISCTTPGPAIWICIGAAVVVAILLEFRKGEDAFGESNDIRVIAGNISSEVKAGTGAIVSGAKHVGGDVSDTFKKVVFG